MVEHSRSFWVTGASAGLGLALVEHLLEQGHRVAASSNACQALDLLAQRHGPALLRLPGQLQTHAGAQAISERIASTWGTLDVLIVNAGTCDYLSDEVPDSEVFDSIASSNLQAAEHCLACALPLLAGGDAPQVMAVFSRYSALQLYAPSQSPNATNNAPQWFRLQRDTLDALGIALTLVAPQSLKKPVTPIQALPERWTAQGAAEELLRRLPQREAELVLEALDMNALWPLSR